SSAASLFPDVDSSWK
ncbi:hypothetical protein A2U01_0052222, partial [Trifolium medium]|nr:hypothetical protein [Trifolium medium]